MAWPRFFPWEILTIWLMPGVNTRADPSPPIKDPATSTVKVGAMAQTILPRAISKVPPHSGTRGGSRSLMIPDGMVRTTRAIAGAERRRPRTARETPNDDCNSPIMGPTTAEPNAITVKTAKTTAMSGWPNSLVTRLLGMDSLQRCASGADSARPTEALYGFLCDA